MGRARSNAPLSPSSLTCPMAVTTARRRPPMTNLLSILPRNGPEWALGRRELLRDYSVEQKLAELEDYEIEDDIEPDLDISL